MSKIQINIDEILKDSEEQLDKLSEKIKEVPAKISKTDFNSGWQKFRQSYAELTESVLVKIRSLQLGKKAKKFFKAAAVIVVICLLLKTGYSYVSYQGTARRAADAYTGSDKYAVCDLTAYSIAGGDNRERAAGRYEAKSASVTKFFTTELGEDYNLKKEIVDTEKLNENQLEKFKKDLVKNKIISEDDVESITEIRKVSIKISGKSESGEASKILMFYLAKEEDGWKLVRTL